MIPSRRLSVCHSVSACKLSRVLIRVPPPAPCTKTVGHQPSDWAGGWRRLERAMGLCSKVAAGCQWGVILTGGEIPTGKLPADRTASRICRRPAPSMRTAVPLAACHWQRGLLVLSSSCAQAGGYSVAARSAMPSRIIDRDAAGRARAPPRARARARAPVPVRRHWRTDSGTQLRVGGSRRPSATEKRAGCAGC
jgi:hypothetical protein